MHFGPVATLLHRIIVEEKWTVNQSEELEPSRGILNSRKSQTMGFGHIAWSPNHSAKDLKDPPTQQSSLIYLGQSIF